MKKATHARASLALFSCICSLAWSASPVPSTDPLAAIDLNRNAIIADIVQGFDGDRSALAKRLAGLRADRLLSASLASTRASLESILAESEKSREVAVVRAGAKVLGSANSDLVYTPITPCRLIDTRGFGAPIQGGAFTPNERRAYVPAGQCGLPSAGVASMLISFTTQNLTPTSGGYLAILGPAAPVTTTVDIFNFNSEWSASNTAVATGPAAQFDAFVNTASAHLVVDILGYFAPPQGTVVKSVTAGTGLTGGTITDTGTVAIAGPYQLPQACTNGQVPQSNGAGAWSCVTPPTPGNGTVTGVTASAPLASSGGAAPDISLTGIVGVANGGTGQSALDPNGILFGQGTAPVGTAVGAPGQVLVITGAPTWSDSLSLNGDLHLADSTPTSGNIVKAGLPFLHNTGFNNTFVGSNAGSLATGSESNSALGASALSGLTSGFANAAVGAQALLGNSIGSSNTAIGRQASFSNTTGSNNVALGSQALANNIGGSNNIAIGFAAAGLTTGGNNILIGHFGAPGENSTTRIGVSQNRTFIAGIRGVTTGIADGIAVLIDSNGQLGTVSSSRRFKDDVTDMDAASGALMKLRPVTFHYKTERAPSASRLQYGLIAEEVAEVYPGLVAHSADGEVETVMYQYLPPMLLNEHQKLVRTVEAQAREIAELKRQSARMAAALERLLPANVAAR